MTKHVSPYGQAGIRRGMIAFLFGRGFSAILTFGAFSLAARVLPLEQYGYYSATIALVELLLALSTGGVDWVAARILPESRIHASGMTTVKWVLALISLQAAIYLIGGTLVYLLAQSLSSALHLHGAEDAFRLAGVMLFVEGTGRLSRDQMLGILMEQKAGQLSQILRSGAFFSALVWISASSSDMDASKLVKIELLAALLASIVGAMFLVRALGKIVHLPSNTPNWRPPETRNLLRLALHTYTSYLLALAYGPQVLTMVIARLLGAEAVAVYGFARGFADQVRRYLPTDLLQSIIRPALIAYYSKERNYSNFTVRLSLWFKSALIVLFPVLLFFSAFGKIAIVEIGGLRFASNWPILAALLFGTAFMAWRRVVELAANVVLASDVAVSAGLVLLATPLLVGCILWFEKSLILAIVVVVASEAIFCIRVMHGLKMRGYDMKWDYMGFFRLAIGWLFCVALSLSLASVIAFNFVSALIYSLTISAVFVLLLRPFSNKELVLISTVSPKVAALLKFSLH